MNTGLSLIFAFRNRDLPRIKASMDSLAMQTNQDFEVIFVDYGSKLKLSRDLSSLLASYNFTKYFYIEARDRLWNKSKALNFGIHNSSSKFIFIADVDLVFHPETVNHLNKRKKKNSFTLFTMAYVGKEESRKFNGEYDLNNITLNHTGKVNGMILSSKESLLKVNGLDEFFHFYGFEDEDLSSRLETAGYKRKISKKILFFHQWHLTYAASESNLLSAIPQLTNIRRINQQHFLTNKENGVIKVQQGSIEESIFSRQQIKKLSNPTKEFLILNILAQVEYFLRERLPAIENEVVKITFKEDPYFNSLKYKIKSLLRKQTQPYCSLKFVNDLVLKEILFTYRSYNYSLIISAAKKEIVLTIEM